MQLQIKVILDNWILLIGIQVKHCKKIVYKIVINL